MIEPRAAAIAYIRFVLETLDITPTALAKLAGISSTTLTRPLYKEGHKFAISMSTISKIASVSDINPAPFFESEDIATRHYQVMQNETIMPGTRIPYSPRKKYPEILSPVGAINTGDWDLNEVANSFQYLPMFLTHTWYKHEDVFGVSIKNSKANMVAQSGEVLLCVKIEALPKPIHPSAIVILQRLSDRDQLIEISACYTQKTDSGWLLRPASYDVDPSVSYLLKDLETESGGMRVIGVVQYVVREPFPLP